MKFAVSASAAALVFASALNAADISTATQLRDKALGDQTAWKVLESLTTEIGGRPIGSPAYERSKVWAEAKLKELGFTNIRTETFLQDTWQRGAESAEIVGPYPQPLTIIGLGRSMPTPKKGIEAEVVVLKSYAALLAAPEGTFKGKIVVVNEPMTRTQDGSGYGAAVPARNGDGEAAKRGAVAYLVRSISTSQSRAPHTGTSGGPGLRIPAAALGVPDADLLENMAARGPVRIRLNMQSTTKAKSTLFNISGEIKGSEKPDEVIVIGGHLDSWDPGTGAIDDGAGIAITTAAAHLIDQLPKHPKRSIRVVFWGSEENGGSSEAYLAAHKDELPKIVLAGESDLGADNVFKLDLPKGALGTPEASLLPGLLSPLRIIVSRQPSTHGGSDTEGLQEAGVPMIHFANDATRYFDIHHSADDTLAVVHPDELAQNVAAWASVIYLMADSDIDFRGGTKK
ncbi:Zn-dependent M28 family amino/carboxypeptidase [Rhizomicrobium palustre]|uniref:Carboxypeptidase Q n=1 Tax=Rhizomicrobium palustre TaxID=189966 RepID=A0A846MW43_9PROT|nr:M20/M25/M40 family metallo-hydrolase [Rhizomicrobium palustre]NIK87449.1 Zn-dependent M28 family amino/carboxypeptidase [Rhizomicrobium palustre]